MVEILGSSRYNNQRSKSHVKSQVIIPKECSQPASASTNTLRVFLFCNDNSTRQGYIDNYRIYYGISSFSNKYIVTGEQGPGWVFWEPVKSTRKSISAERSCALPVEVGMKRVVSKYPPGCLRRIQGKKNDRACYLPLLGAY